MGKKNNMSSFVQMIALTTMKDELKTTYSLTNISNCISSSTWVEAIGMGKRKLTEEA